MERVLDMVESSCKGRGAGRLDSRRFSPYTPTMRNNIGFFLGVGALLGAALAPVRATEPTRQPAQADPSAAHAVPATARAEVGKVLVLDNERTLTGEIERIDDQYRIKRLIGQTWIPASKVLKLCASLEEAHAFLRSRTNLSDPDERLRLADWCRQHGLRDRALAEAQEALALRPQDSRAKRLVSYLLDAKAKADAPPPPAAPEKALPRIDVTAESLTVFASRVQPILMNACASCHTGGRGGSFQVTRTYSSSGLGNRKALEQNLAAAFAHVNAREPQMSRLLTKSVSIHGPGMTKAPLPGRQARAYGVLEQWVLETLANNPQLRESQPVPAPTAQASAAPVFVLPPPPPPARSSEWGGDRPASAAPPAAQAAAAPRAPVESTDPVDPGQFNREFHPERQTPRP
jgi:hypothetical protein